VQFKELTDGQWDYLRLFIPPQPKVSRKRADDRNTINSILFVLITDVAGVTCPDTTALPSQRGEEAEAVVRRGRESGTGS
jgi:transposase